MTLEIEFFLTLIFQTWQGKMEFQQKVIPYFCDVQKHIAPVLRNLGPAEVVNNVFRMTGYLIKYCAKLIYVRVCNLFEKPFTYQKLIYLKSWVAATQILSIIQHNW